MIDSAQLKRLIVQTETLSILHPQHDPNDLMKLARVIYNTALEEAANIPGMPRISRDAIRALKGKP